MYFPLLDPLQTKVLFSKYSHFKLKMNTLVVEVCIYFNINVLLL